MADPAPTGTVVPVSAPSDGGGGSTGFTVPEGKVLIDASEHQTWQRQREQLAGLTRFQGAAAKLGRGACAIDPGAVATQYRQNVYLEGYAHAAVDLNVCASADPSRA